MSPAPEARHGLEPVSDWVRRWSHLVPPGAHLLDVACGRGRHARWFAGRGCRVTGVDRDADALASIEDVAETLCADLESGPWPYAPGSFDAVVVTHYLWRENLAHIVEAVAPGGLLIYETFASGNETLGKPSNPKFLLQPGELLRACATLRVLAFEDGFEPAHDTRPARFVQRIVAVREAPGSTPGSTCHGLWPEPFPPQLKSPDSEEPV